MSHKLWRIGTDTPDHTADDLTGTGARISGGRWNRKGTALVYCSESRALACIESVVHLVAGSLPLNRYLIELTVPRAVWQAAQTLNASSAPVGWDAQPEGKVSLDYGTQWVISGSSALLRVPSTIVPEEFNVLINPLHPQAGLITAVKLRRWLYDPRLRI